VGEFTFTGNNPTNFIGETVRIVPEVQSPLASVLGSSSPQRLGFNLEMWAPFAALSSVRYVSLSNNAGFALGTWRPTPFNPTMVDVNGNPVTQVFQGIDVDVLALSTTQLLGITYNITLLGRIVSFGVVVI
jgi:hypothetical protein